MHPPHPRRFDRLVGLGVDVGRRVGQRCGDWDLVFYLFCLLVVLVVLVVIVMPPPDGAQKPRLARLARLAWRRVQLAGEPEQQVALLGDLVHELAVGPRRGGGGRTAPGTRLGPVCIFVRPLVLVRRLRGPRVRPDPLLLKMVTSVR